MSIALESSLQVNEELVSVTPTSALPTSITNISEDATLPALSSPPTPRSSAPPAPLRSSSQTTPRSLKQTPPTSRNSRTSSRDDPRFSLVTSILVVTEMRASIKTTLLGTSFRHHVALCMVTISTTLVLLGMDLIPAVPVITLNILTTANVGLIILNETFITCEIFYL